MTAQDFRPRSGWHKPKTITGDADRDWMTTAACRGEWRTTPTGHPIRIAGPDPEIFFPTITPGRRSTRTNMQRAAEAKAICLTCPVTVQCAEYRTQIDSRFGVWGGLSEDQYPNGESAKCGPSADSTSSAPKSSPSKSATRPNNPKSSKTRRRKGSQEARA